MSVQHIQDVLTATRNGGLKRLGGGYQLVKCDRTSKGSINIMTETFKGITNDTDGLKRWFWENYDHRSAAKNRERGDDDAPRLRYVGRQTARVMGRHLGTQIHAELADYTSKITKRMDVATFNTKHPKGLLSASKRATKHIKALGWKLWFAELPVYDPSLSKNRWATEIDLVAYDPANKRVVLIEVKTGYNNKTFSTPSGPMTGKMLLNNSPLNQAKVQLVASALLFESLYIPPGKSIYDYGMYILHVPTSGEPVSAWPVRSTTFKKITAVLRAPGGWWNYKRTAGKNKKRPRVENIAHGYE